ncbi:MAG: hypothetical protein SVV80_11625 [Planctomycetota bacterium]|nr:hypothetical protein [Planctomycetota bacterium]
MTDSQKLEMSRKPKKPLWRRILKWTVRIAVVLVVLLIGVWSVWNYVTARSLRNEINSISAAGAPLTFRELADTVDKVDEAKDAGPYYAAALALLRRANQNERDEVQKKLNKVVEKASPVPPELLADAQRLNIDNRLTLEMLDRGSAMSGCNYDIGIEYGISVCLPRLDSAKKTARIVSLRTKLLALQGQGDKAVDSAISSLRMLRMFDRQPVMVCCLVKIACMSLFSSDVPVILEFGRPSAESLGRLQDALEEAEESINLKRMWIAERVYSMEIMRNLISGGRKLEASGEGSLPMPERWPSRLASPFARTMATRMLRVHARFITAAGKDWPEVLDAIRAIAAQQSPSAFDTFGQILTPAFERTAVILGRTLATVRSARLAIMIERYRHARGKLPQSLAEIETETAQKSPLDPFTGKILIYRKTDDGYKVFSLGDDRKENTHEELNRGDVADWGVHIRLLPAPPE